MGRPRTKWFRNVLEDKIKGKNGKEIEKKKYGKIKYACRPLEYNTTTTSTNNNNNIPVIISRLPVTLLRYCLSEFEMVPVAPDITGITFAF